ncbi:hypothetical protein [Mycobacterium sp. DBP42]|uniref:hypothetical protein n=1 Tax=Mycobacteriaceae TaxID=1762 RepID=UPI00110C97F1|nr:hypothetical protein [Mycobacterium sp. DBP42]TMS50716.1 hypothetical protein E0T84_22805 [Mycobacterium sp. DBP42]
MPTSPLCEPIKKLIAQGLDVPALSDADRAQLTALMDRTDHTGTNTAGHLVELLIQARDVLSRYPDHGNSEFVLTQ